MGKFRFSLEILLKHREDIEQRELDALMRLAYTYQVTLRDLDLLKQKLSDTMNELSHSRSKNASFHETSCFYPYMNRLRDEIEECEKRLAKLDSEIQKQKEIVIQATKNRKVLSKLKSKKEKEFILSLDKKEQREVEEWVAARYGAERQSYR